MKKIIYFLILVFCWACNSTTNEFDLCSGKLHPYYYPELTYTGDFYAIKKHYYTNYKEVNAPNNNGIVKIRFHINCKGESGNYKVESYSFDYATTEIDSNITEQLIQLTKSLTEWIPAQNEDGDAVNSHKFFAFKIKNGQLIDILPK